MTTDFRALCAELADELHDFQWAVQEAGVGWACPDTESLIDRARAALAEPEPVGPTDEEIMELMPQQMRDDLAAAARALAGFDPDNIKAASVFRIILNRHSVDHARAVLARWGRPAPQPVPVSERLPKEPLAWWFTPESDEEYGWWVLEPNGMEREPQPTHWLPAHTLPLPTTSRSN